MKTREFCAVFAVAATVWGWCAGAALADAGCNTVGGAVFYRLVATPAAEVE